MSEIIHFEKPDFIFHLAAQSLVLKSYKYPIETLRTNIWGTLNLLECLKHYKNKLNVIFITSDKCYKNFETDKGYSESDHLGGDDLYSASKASAEIIINAYFKSFLKNNNKISIATVRAGNVIGGGDWSLDRLIPDAIRAWTTNSSLEIRNPDSVRPWQHVLEPIFGYLVLAENLFKSPSFSGSYNFGPNADDNVSVKSIINIAQGYFENAEVKYSNNEDLLHEAGLLTLDNRNMWRSFFRDKKWFYWSYGGGFFIISLLVLQTYLDVLFNSWYKDFYEGMDPLKLCNKDIDHFMKSISNLKNNE